MKKYNRYKFTKEELVRGGKSAGTLVMSKLTVSQRKKRAIKAATIRWTKYKLSTGVINK